CLLRCIISQEKACTQISLTYKPRICQYLCFLSSQNLQVPQFFHHVLPHCLPQRRRPRSWRTRLSHPVMLVQGLSSAGCSNSSSLTLFIMALHPSFIPQLFLYIGRRPIHIIFAPFTLTRTIYTAGETQTALKTWHHDKQA
ncbi:glutaredoxin domain-containing protein, partial [Moniliophthora roreri]